MKNRLYLGLLFLTILFIASCATPPSSYYRYQANNDFLTESWSRFVKDNPKPWLKNADAWFLRGDPNNTELYNRRADLESGVSDTRMKVHNFTEIFSNGSYQLQIFGGVDQNSVMIYGPLQETSQVAVRLIGNKLFIQQAAGSTMRLSHVIIRVGVNNLRRLKQCGPGFIEARQINSNGLVVESIGTGNMLIAGFINLRAVNTSGAGGTVTILGAQTRFFKYNYASLH